MARYRNALPQLGTASFLTDSGLETDLIFHHGVDLPDFAAFTLLRDPAGTALLDDYFRAHALVAAAEGVGVVLESATWRASPDWAARLGYDAAALDAANRAAIDLLVPIRDEFDAPDRPAVLSGCLGPREDGYVATGQMTPSAAADYHAEQIGSFAATEADQVTVLTLNYPAEGIGIALAAHEAGMPAVLSFTVETDGRLPDGTPLGEAITSVEDATDSYPAYYMINCAHPTHFSSVLDPSWMGRVRGLRANASGKSHAELDEATELDDGDPAELGGQYAELRSAYPQLTVLGGCCGTDVRHVQAIAAACMRS